MQPLVAIDNIVCKVAGRSILDGLSLTVDRGESVAVIGPSGSGKSILKLCISICIEPR